MAEHFTTNVEEDKATLTLVNIKRGKWMLGDSTVRKYWSLSSVLKGRLNVSLFAFPQSLF